MTREKECEQGVRESSRRVGEQGQRESNERDRHRDSEKRQEEREQGKRGTIREGAGRGSRERLSRERGTEIERETERDRVIYREKQKEEARRDILMNFIKRKCFYWLIT